MYPLLSIIVPVYNVEKYVAQCLSSIVDSGVDTGIYEVVVVNDGTRDGSMDIVHAIVDGRPNVTIVEQENQGLSMARTNGLAKAGGEYVWFIDSDDFLTQDGLARVADLLKDGSETDLFITPLYWRYADKGLDHRDIPETIHRSGEGVEYLKTQRIPIWAAPRYIIKKSLFDSPSLFFPRSLIHEDEYFGRVLLYLAKTVAILPDPVYNYRQRELSIVHSKTIRTSYDLVSIYKLLSTFMYGNVSSEDRAWFRSAIVGLMLESYTKNKELYGTDEFRRFLKDNRPFIWAEYRKESKDFPRNRRISDSLMILAPRLHDRIFSLYYKLKHS